MCAGVCVCAHMGVGVMCTCVHACVHACMCLFGTRKSWEQYARFS